MEPIPSVLQMSVQNVKKTAITNSMSKLDLEVQSKKKIRMIKKNH